MTIEQFCNKLEIFLYDTVVDNMENGDEGSEHLFFQYDWDSDTYWVNLGLPDEWFDNEDEEEDDE